MALIRMNFFSDVLGMCVPVTVILPQRTHDQTEAGFKHPVLWLLHGASDDHTIWTRYTSIERYAQKQGLCVIMPSAHMSRYQDMAHGGRFFSYIADELPQIMRSFFPLSEARTHNFICGLSMGGAGALRIGLQRPGQYAAIGCLSAAASNYDTKQLDDPRYVMSQRLVFGDRDPAEEMRDVLGMAQEIIDRGKPIPRIYHACGRDDYLLENARMTRDFFQALNGNPFGYVYEEDEGSHEWGYWDAHIQRFLNFIGSPITHGGQTQ